jgi:hypothetical protein
LKAVTFAGATVGTMADETVALVNGVSDGLLDGLDVMDVFDDLMACD